MVEGEAVAVFPAFPDEGRDEEEQGAFRLVEIRNQPRDDAHLVGWRYHQGGAGFEAGEAVAVEVGQHCLQGFGRCQRGVVFVGEPLLHVQRPELQALFGEHHAEPIEAFQGARARRTHGDDGFAVVGYQVFYQRLAHDDGFGVHGVFADGVGGHRLEGARAHVERHLVEQDALLAQLGDERLGEVEACRGGGHRAVVAREDGLVAVAVGGFGFAVQVGRQRNLARRLQDRGEREVFGRPRELDFRALVVAREAFRKERGWRAGHRQGHGEQAVFPAFGVADQAFPAHRRARAEGHLIVLFRLQAKHLDARACRLAELQARPDDLGLVEDQ